MDSNKSEPFESRQNRSAGDWAVDHSDSPRHDEDDSGQGRIGYGSYARYSPTILGLLIVAVVAFIGWREWRPDDDLPRTGQLIDQPAPPFSLTLFDGQSVSLDDFKGQAVALNFWASWCAPCKSEMPAFQEVSANSAASNEQRVIVGVGLKNDNDQNARDLVQELGVTYPLGRDTAGNNPVRGPIERAYGVTTYPATVFIRPDGTVYAVRIGEVTADEIRQYFDGAQERV